MKILIILNGLGNEGVTTIALTYLYELLHSEIKFEVVAAGPCEQGKLNELKKQMVAVYQLPNRKNHTVQYIFELYKLLKKERYDVVHIHGNSATMAIDMFISWICGCKVRIAHCHNTKCDNEKINYFLKPFLIMLTTARFACGEDAGNWLYGSNSFEVIHNGRDIEKYRFDNKKRSLLRNQLGVNPDDIIIGHVGTFTYQKNQERLINLLYDLQKKKSESYKLVLVGDGPLKERIKKQIEEKGLGDSVILTGNINNVADYLSAMDIMILPSKYEGLPLVAIEWQANGLPCIFSSNVTRQCKVMDNVEFISLDESNDRWINCIQDLLKKGRIKNFQLIGEKMKNLNFDIKENSKKLEKLYLSYKK